MPEYVASQEMREANDSASSLPSSSSPLGVAEHEHGVGERAERDGAPGAAARPSPCRSSSMAYRTTPQADALKLVGQKLQSSLAVEGELPEDGLAACGDDDLLPRLPVCGAYLRSGRLPRRRGPSRPLCILNVSDLGRRCASRRR